MASNYDRQVFKQLEEVIKKCDNLSQEINDIKRDHRQEIYIIKEEHKKEVKKLKQQIDKLEKENEELKDKVDILEGKSNQKTKVNNFFKILTIKFHF